MPRSRLDGVLPAWDFRERHSIALDAPSERVFAAIKEVTPAEMPVVRALFRLRGLPAANDRPVYEQLQPRFQALAEDPGRELVLGSIAKPWRWRGGHSPQADFASFAEPGYAKLALSFRFEDGTLSTETRVLLTDRASRRVFRCYWLFVRPWSGLIRRSWLRAAAARSAGRGPSRGRRRAASLRRG
jgi:hypothetical protein